MDWIDFLLFALLAGFAFAIFFFMFAFLYIYFAVEMDEEDERKMMRDLNEALSRMADKSGGIIMATALCLSLCSCASRKTAVPSTITIKDSVRIERLIPHPIDPRESSIEAWIECDRRGRVLLSRIEELEDDKLSLSLSLDSLGMMLVEARTAPDTIWIKADSVIVYNKEEVIVPVERELTKGEKVKMRIGEISALLALISIFIALRSKST